MVDQSLIEWMNENPFCVSLGFPSSGNRIMWYIVHRVTERNIKRIWNTDYFEFDNVLYWTGHYHLLNCQLPKHGKIIIIIRDPRDAFIGNANRQSKIMGIEADIIIKNMSWLIKRTIMWREYFEVLSKYDHIVIQYENFCLNPVVQINKILDFVGADAINDIAQIIEETDNISWDNSDIEYNSGEERYNIHCLKWKRSPLATKEYLDTIWDHLKHYMESFGYIQTGHNRESFI